LKLKSPPMPNLMLFFIIRRRGGREDFRDRPTPLRERFVERLLIEERFDFLVDCFCDLLADRGRRPKTALMRFRAMRVVVCWVLSPGGACA
jgi:hypothetical protein